MRSFLKLVIISVLLCAGMLSAHAQSEDKNIKDAKTVATSAIATDAKKLPDSLAWKKGGSAALNFSQTLLSDSWSGGGENMLVFGSTVNLFANYKKNKVIWENSTFLAYGLMKKGDGKATKNDDRINVGSRVGYQMAKNWYYSLAFLGKTQFTSGYQYTATDTIRVSDFFAPANLFLALGLDYKPSSGFSMAISPIMGKATLVRSGNELVMITSGLTPELIADGKRARYEFGGGIIFNLNGDFFSKRVTYLSQLELFSNYMNNPQNIDVIWDFQFRIALTKFVAAGVRLNMIYDDDKKTIVDNKPRGAKLQVKNFFEIGLYYDF